jgi:Dyp-type peroxidase family
MDAVTDAVPDSRPRPYPSSADLADIQGLIYSAWADHPYAAYIFATLGEARRSRAWLQAVRTQVTSADPGRRPTQGRIQLALSPRGLAALGVPLQVVAQLPHEARAGMRARARILGDEAPLDWTLGAEDELDVLVMVYARDEASCAAMVDHQRHALQAAGARLLPTEMSRPPGAPHASHRASQLAREHFGFADGVSQPFIQGLHQRPRPGNDHVAAGEIVLGYPNAYGRLPHSPRWVSADLRSELDLGRNGTYLVFRKLEQHVERFWGYVTERALALGNGDTAATAPLAERLAAKMMGRWRSGAALAVAPDFDDPAATLPDRINSFGYLTGDRDGLRCPISSHVRRANPRDARGGSVPGSLRVTGRHRILRRGRSYGPLLPEAEARAGRNDGNSRGLYFICLQTSIARGFEFIQQTWLNNRGFGGLNGESDPIAGNGGCPFTIPEDPLRLRLPAVPRLVSMRGGGYFFLPSLTALAHVAEGL